MKPFPRSGLPGVQPPVGPSETTTSIGRRCKRSDALSRAVLIAREAFPLFQRFSSRCVSSPDPSRFKTALVAFHCRKVCFSGSRERVIPVPIPNTEVKPPFADGTWPPGPGE